MPLIHALERRKFLDKSPVPQVLNMGSNLATMLLGLKDGQELRAPESDVTETVFCVLSGEGEILEGETRHPVKAGDVVHIPAGETKALIAGDGEMSVLGVRHVKGRS